MTLHDEFSTIVIDNGSHTIKAGFSGEYQPGTSFPTVVWRQKGMIELGGTPWAVGERASGYRKQDLRYPICRGKIIDWEDVELIWKRCYYNLGADTEGNRVLMTESPSIYSKVDREKMAQLVFDSMCIPSMYIANQAVMTLFGNDKVNGLVLESGDGSSHTVPIYEGFALNHATTSLEMGGMDVTKYLETKLNERNETKLYAVEDIKEKYCHVFLDWENERLKENETISYQLPDDCVILLGNEIFEVPECLFKPKLMDFDCKGIHEDIIPSIEKCDQDIRNEMYRNIVLGGGNTLLKGFSNRIAKECNTISPIQITISETNQGALSSWVGASIFSKTSQFNELCITNKEYQECGSTIVYRKFF